MYIIGILDSDGEVREFKVDASNEEEAINLVADIIAEQELDGLYADYYEIFDLCEVGQTVSEYAEANNLTCAGKHGIYIRVEEITNENCHL